MGTFSLSQSLAGTALDSVDLAQDSPYSSPFSEAENVLSSATPTPENSPAFPQSPKQDNRIGSSEQSAGSYYANPLPSIPNNGSKEPLKASVAAVAAADFGSDTVRTRNDCYEYVVNGSFEEDGAWFGQPSTNVGHSQEYFFSGARGIFLNSNFYNNAAVWQQIEVPAEAESITLSFQSGISIPEPGESIYVAIYDETFSELIYWNYPAYSLDGWDFFSMPLTPSYLAGRTIQLAFQTEHDYDGLYAEAVFDDVSLSICSSENVEPPTATPRPTTIASPTQAPQVTPSATPTLLPSNTPTSTPPPVNTPQPGGGTLDLSIGRIQVGQALMAEEDPVTGESIPLIAEKPALIRVYLNLSGANAVQNVDGALFIEDAQGTVTSVEPLGGPFTLTGNSQEEDANSTLNFVPNARLLNGSLNIWAEVDPANVIPESNETNNRVGKASYTFQPGPKMRIAWVDVNQGVNRQIADQGDSDLRRFYPVGINDVEYFFQPGFNQPLNVLLTPSSYPQYFNALNRFWDRMTHEGRWVGGTPPDRLYGWTAGETTGLCGVADASWVGGRGRVATGFALSCGAETMAHELGHIVDNQGFRHSPNRPGAQDPQCTTNSPAGPEPLYPNYLGLPLGSIGVTGFDAANMQLLSPARNYDFMSYCAPEWISPFNYNKLANGFAPVAGTIAAAQETDPGPRLLVSGLVYTETVRAELDPFYTILSTVAPEESRGSQFCIELRDEGESTLESRCFDLGFTNIESGQPTLVDGFSMVLPYPQEIASVVFLHKGETLASREVSSNQPFVRLTSPVGGESLSGSDSINVTWNGADLDEDSLFYSLSYSIDNGDSWLPIATDLTAMSYEVDLNQLPGSTQVKFRVGASDGINTVYDTSDGLEIGMVSDTSITVSGKAPTAAIRTERGVYDTDRVIILEGTGYDLEDGLLPEEGLEWWSNRDGVLGSGSWLQTVLSVGAHEIVLKVADSAGNSQTDTVQITIGSTSRDLYLPFITN